MKEQIKQFPSLGEQAEKLLVADNDASQKKVADLTKLCYDNVAKYAALMKQQGKTADEVADFISKAFVRMYALITDYEERLQDPNPESPF